MATQPSEQEGNSIHAELSAGNVVNEHDCQLLLKAAFKGDWESADRIFQANPKNSKTAIITSRSETVLHIAALNAQDQFVENLVNLPSQSPAALEAVDCDERTALHHAVLCGRIRIVEALFRKCSELTQKQDKDGRIPFNLSSQEASMHKDIAWFLAVNMKFNGPIDPEISSHAIQCVVDLTYAGHLDIVLYLLREYPSLMLKKVRKKEDKSGPGEEDKSILGMLASSPSHFRSGTRLSVLEALIYKCIPVDINSTPIDANLRALQYLTRPLWNAAKIVVPLIKRIHDEKLRHEAAVKLVKKVCIALSEKNHTEITQFFLDGDLLGVATLNGISELVKLSIQHFPEVIWIKPYKKTLMTLAVQRRHDRILRLFLKESSTNGLSLVPPPTGDEPQIMMQVASNFYPNFDYLANVSGATFQMQRELQWFKAVESWVAPELRIAKFGEDNKTLWEIFVADHKKLLEDGQKWVKDTSDKCMLVSTLIATVLFAAAFAVPETNNDSKIVRLEGFVLVFAIFDGLGLFFSVAATLLFLAILTSPTEPLDFLDSLPKKIIMGLFSLFLSLVFMLVAFAATLTLVLDKTMERVLIPIILLTSFPLTIFVVLQFPLLFQMIKSTYGPSIFRSEGIWK
ncbi:hypothetical protein BT93_C1805 [Corymbia citriodora subsp. variegata]|nr:hypothetical protein BT93_C1805 [Corymbia citriodora subsp. variegata]